MPFHPVILWTDALIYLLLATGIILGIYARRHEHMLASWRKVIHSASGMSALTILLCFILIGLLDTIHFRPALEQTHTTGENIYSAEVLSVFDLLATPLRSQMEKTYSAPYLPIYMQSR